MCDTCRYQFKTRHEYELLESYLYPHFRDLGFLVTRGIVDPSYSGFNHSVWTCGVCFALVAGDRVHEHFLAAHSDKPYTDIWEYIREAEEKLRSESEDH